MDYFLLLLISLSMSASIIGGLLLACKPLYRNRMSKTWQYYIWIVVVVRLLVPLAPEANLMNLFFGRGPSAAAVTETRIREEGNAPQPLPEQERPRTETPPAAAVTEASLDAGPAMSGSRLPTRESLFMLWLLIAAVLLARKLTSYHSFVRYIRAGRQEITDEETLTAYQRACEEVGVRRIPPVYCNPLAASPMLVGILRPCIILPRLETDADSIELVLRHELIHCKRGDLVYKWLVQLALSLHWFNPLVYLIGREIDRNCELSCDEAVISAMPDQHKSDYGDILLASASGGGSYSGTVASVTLSEDGRNLKERLSAILQFQPGSRRTKAAALGLSVLVLCGAFFAGAYVGRTTARQSVAGWEAGDADATLQRDTLLHLVTVESGAAASEPFWAQGPYIALYFQQKREGAFDVAIQDESTGVVVQHETGISFYDKEDHFLVFAAPPGQYSLTVSNLEDDPREIAVYGATLEKAEDYHRFSEYLYDSNYYQEQWDEFVNQASLELQEQYSKAGGPENWMYLASRYEKGYLVSIGYYFEDSLENYSSTVDITANWEPMTLAFAPGYEQYADDKKALNIARDILSERHYAFQFGKEFYVVQSVQVNGDASDLLRQLYANRDFPEFTELLEHCDQKPVVEELLHQAANDGESLYFYMMADYLPIGFSGAEELARTAVERGDALMLYGLYRYLDPVSFPYLLLDLSAGNGDQ